MFSQLSLGPLKSLGGQGLAVGSLFLLCCFLCFVPISHWLKP